MFSFLFRNRRTLEAWLKILSFMGTVIIEAVMNIVNYMERELATSSQ